MYRRQALQGVSLTKQTPCPASSVCGAHSASIHVQRSRHTHNEASRALPACSTDCRHCRSRAVLHHCGLQHLGPPSLAGAGHSAVNVHHQLVEPLQCRPERQRQRQQQQQHMLVAKHYLCQRVVVLCPELPASAGQRGLCCHLGQQAAPCCCCCCPEKLVPCAVLLPQQAGSLG